MDTEKIESLIYQLLEALGEDPNREGLIETPKRVSPNDGRSIRRDSVYKC